MSEKSDIITLEEYNNVTLQMEDTCRAWLAGELTSPEYLKVYEVQVNTLYTIREDLELAQQEELEFLQSGSDVLLAEDFDEEAAANCIFQQAIDHQKNTRYLMYAIRQTIHDEKHIGFSTGNNEMLSRILGLTYYLKSWPFNYDLFFRNQLSDHDALIFQPPDAMP